MQTMEKDVFFLTALNGSLAPAPQEGPFHVMFVRRQHTQEPKKTINLRLESFVVERCCANKTYIEVRP